MLEIRENGDALIFDVYVQPRASKNAIVGCHDKALKIKLTAPPVDNAANKQCVQVLAKALSVSKSCLAIIAGQTSRSKRLKLQSPAGTFSQKELAGFKKQLQQLAEA